MTFFKKPNALVGTDSILCQNIVAHILNPNDHIKIIACIPDKLDVAILDTINQISFTTDKINKFFVWALLNSKLINWYVYRFIYGKAIRTMHFDSPVTNRIPLEIPPSLPIYSVIYYCLRSIRHKIFIYILDALIFNLYFPDHMKERSIDVLEFVERDIKAAMQGREFENLSHTEKEKVINQLHQTWTDPENEVVKRMAMFKEKSPDILKPILES